MTITNLLKSAGNWWASKVVGASQHSSRCASKNWDVARVLGRAATDLRLACVLASVVLYVFAASSIMNSDYVKKFMSALERGDESSALTLLETGRVTINSQLHQETEGVRHSYPLLFAGVQFAQEQVVRALVRLGASIDTFRVSSDGKLRTAAGDAIARSDISALSLCVRLGADLSCVLDTRESPQMLTSGVGCAILLAQPVSLSFLLDEVYTARPVHLSQMEVMYLTFLARLGSPAMVIFKVLESRGFSFKSLEGMKSPVGEGSSSVVSAADVLLAGAQKKGDAHFLRYLVKDLGLVSTAGQMEDTKDFVERQYSDVDVHPHRADLTKYECATCEAIGATKICAGCKASRYCSGECQSRHWKTGGHKKECKEIQRLAKEMAENGVSGASGSSVS